MSEQQKVFASLSGAVVVHLLLLMAVFFLLSTRSVRSSLRSDQMPEPQPNQPQEVTIVMGDLMEQIEVEPAPPESFAKPFISTDLNQAEAEAPEDAKFESDRNTTAAAEMAPDPNQPQVYGPTTEGNSPLPYLELQTRKFVDGELNRPPATTPGEAESAEAAPASAAPSPTQPQMRSDLAPAPESGEGESDEAVEGVDTPPEYDVAEKRLRPAENPSEGTEEEMSQQRSFLDPNSSGNFQIAPGEEEKDQFAMKRPPVEEGEGDPTDEAQTQEIAKSGTGVDTEESADAPPEAAPDPSATKAADAGLFADGFNPEQIQRSANGTLSNIGQNAVDAEGTEVGKYKQAVKSAIAQKWHRYRVKHGDFVTWGLLKIECRVDRYGKVHGLKLVKNEANSVLAEFSLRAILDADLPPMPPDVAKELGEGGLELKYDIIIY